MVKQYTVFLLTIGKIVLNRYVSFFTRMHVYQYQHIYPSIRYRFLPAWPNGKRLSLQILRLCPVSALKMEDFPLCSIFCLLPLHCSPQTQPRKSIFAHKVSPSPPLSESLYFWASILVVIGSAASSISLLWLCPVGRRRKSLEVQSCFWVSLVLAVSGILGNGSLFILVPGSVEQSSLFRVPEGHRLRLLGLCLGRRSEWPDPPEAQSGLSKIHSPPPN